MTDPDDALEARLRALAVEADPPPEWVRAAARAAFAVRDLDAELAELVADSWADDAVLTRDSGDVLRMLSFETGDVRIEVDVEPGADGARLHGVVVGLAGELTVVHAGGRTAVPVEDGGRFDVAGIPAGPVRLEGTTVAGVRVATAWVTT